jgi:hypothetical protein
MKEVFKLFLSHVLSMVLVISLITIFIALVMLALKFLFWLSGV